MEGENKSNILYQVNFLFNQNKVPNFPKKFYKKIQKYKNISHGHNMVITSISFFFFPFILDNLKI